MADLANLLVVIGAKIDGFEKAMGDVSKQIGGVMRDAEKAFSGLDKIGDKFTGIGTALTAGVTLPLGGIALAAVKTASDFEDSFAKITALAGITGPSLERLREQALKLGADTRFSSQQAADGMTVFASAGFNAEQIYAAMPGTLALAAAGQLSIADAATITKDILGQFALAASESGRVADILAQASADASATLGEMGNTLTYVGPVAKGAGQSLEETVAAIVALDAAGIRGEKAGTGLRGVIGSLVAPSKEAKQYLDQLGVSIADQTGHVKPLSDIMESLKQKLSSVGSEAEKQNIIFQIFGREAGNAAQVLIQTGGPALDAFEQKLLASAGAAERMAAILNKTTKGSLDQFKGSAETAAIALGTALLPSVNRLLQLGTQLLNEFVIPAAKWFGELPVPIQNTVIALAAFAAAAGPAAIIAGQVVGAVGTLGTAFTGLTGIIVKFLPQISTLFTLLTTSGFIGPLTQMESLLVRIGGFALPALGVGIAALGAVIAAQRLKEPFEELLIVMQPLIDRSRELATVISGPVVSAFNTIAITLTNISHGLIDLTGLTQGLGAKILAYFDPINQSLFPLRIIIAAITEAFSILTGVIPGMTKEAEKLAKAKQALVGATGEYNKALALSIDQFNAARTPASNLTKEVEALRTQLAAKGKVLAQGNETLEQYRDRLRQAAGGLTLTGKEGKKATEALSDNEKIVKILNKSLDDAELQLSEVRKAYQLHAASAEDVAKAEQRVKDVLAALHPEWNRTTDAAKAAREEAKAYAALLDEKVNVTMEDTVKMQKQLADAIQSAALPVDALTKAFKTLGITTSGELKRAADAAAAAYETIRDSGVATAAQIQEAYLKMIEASARYRKSQGEDVREVEESLRGLGDKVEQHGQRQKTVWQGIGDDIRGAFGSISQTIGDLLAHGEFSLGKLGEAFKNVFQDVAAKAISHFIDAGINVLLSQLDKLLTKIPGVGKAFGDVFGGTSGGGGTGGQGGTGGGETGGGGGGLLDAIGSVFTGFLSGLEAGATLRIRDEIIILNKTFADYYLWISGPFRDMVGGIGDDVNRIRRHLIEAVDDPFVPFKRFEQAMLTALEPLTNILNWVNASHGVLTFIWDEAKRITAAVESISSQIATGLSVVSGGEGIGYLKSMADDLAAIRGSLTAGAIGLSEAAVGSITAALAALSIGVSRIGGLIAEPVIARLDFIGSTLSKIAALMVEGAPGIRPGTAAPGWPNPPQEPWIPPDFVTLGLNAFAELQQAARAYKGFMGFTAPPILQPAFAGGEVPRVIHTHVHINGREIATGMTEFLDDMGLGR